MTLEKDERLRIASQSKTEPSMLITGFGMRNLKSFQDALTADKYKRLMELYMEQQMEREMGEGGFQPYCTKVGSATTSTSDFLSQTDFSTPEGTLQKRNLEYLLGIDGEVEEAEPEPIQEEEEELKPSDSFVFSSSKSMKEAQKYLRYHRIFEVFQFIAAHLISSRTDNPIDFILDLLNRCLLYRSGHGKPPLLYDKNHIGQLFVLMDRLGRGYIDIEQYHTGMRTLGICSYKENPVMVDNTVSKDIFVEEVYDAELDLFNELIRRRYSKDKPPQRFEQTGSGPSIASTTFIPSDLFLFLKKFNATASDG